VVADRNDADANKASNNWMLKEQLNLRFCICVASKRSVKNPIDIVDTGVDLDSGKPLTAATIAVTTLQQNSSNSR